MSHRTWLITGSSRGFGRALAAAALEAGDHVAATARSPQQLDDLAERYGDQVLTIALDVTDAAAAEAAVAKAADAFGSLAVIANNAGYADSAAIEDIPAHDFRAQIETNLFGVVNVTRAALPVFRAQRSGHFLQFSSIGGRVGGSPGMGAYQTAKFGVEGFSEVLNAEVRPLGIKVTIVEPGGFATEWGTTSAHRARQLPAYDAARASLANIRTASTPGDPKATASALLRIVDAAEPPLRVFFGDAGLPMIKREYAERIATWKKWNDVSLEAQGNLAAR